MARVEPSIDRFVLVIGETGVGKSTIVNMLYNQDCSVDCCKWPQKTGNSAAAVTQFSSMQFDWRRKWAILDTVGVGDPSLSQEQILGSIRKLIKDTSKGVHSVVVVMKMGRASHASRANAHVLSHLFNAADLKTHGVLVLTHWEGELGNEQKDLLEWYRDDHLMQAYCEQFSSVVLTNNQLQGRGAYPECRQSCLDQLCRHIESKDSKIKARPVNVMELFVCLIERFAEKLWNTSLSVTTMVLGCETQDLPTYCGECSICWEQMNIKDACKLACNHIFHDPCLTNAVTHCPLCRAEVVKEWQFLEWFLAAGL